MALREGPDSTNEKIITEADTPGEIEGSNDTQAMLIKRYQQTGHKLLEVAGVVYADDGESFKQVHKQLPPRKSSEMAA